MYKYLSNNRVSNLDVIKELIHLQKGGALDIQKLDKLLEYIKKKIPTKKTEKKYFVILWGAPASGKTFSRNIAISIIEHYIDLSVHDDIRASFIDTGLDDIIYDMVYKDEVKTCKELLVNNLHSKLSNITESDYNDLTNIDIKNKIKHEILKKIVELVDSANSIYNKCKDYGAPAISDLLTSIAVALGNNIFLETTGGKSAPDYLSNKIAEYKYYNYIPIIIYPIIHDVKVLYDRSIERGITEGRFMACDYIKDIMITAYNGFSEVKKLCSITCVYNAEFDIETMNKIKEKTQNAIEVLAHSKYLYEFSLSIESNQKKEHITEIDGIKYPFKLECK